MTIQNLKYLMNDPTKTIALGFNDKIFITKTEKLLIENGYRWRGRESGKLLITEFSLDDCPTLTMYINFDKIEPKILSYSTTPTYDFINSIWITDETFELLHQYFNPKPDYKPRKIIREI